MTFDLELSKRRTLVTTGTKGVGAAVVEVLSENGVGAARLCVVTANPRCTARRRR